MVMKAMKTRATGLLRKIKTKIQKEIVKYVAKVSQNIEMFYDSYTMSHTT